MCLFCLSKVNTLIVDFWYISRGFLSGSSAADDVIPWFLSVQVIVTSRSNSLTISKKCLYRDQIDFSVKRSNKKQSVARMQEQNN